jgi:hypothetical protein
VFVWCILFGQVNNKELITFLMGVVEVIANHISRECAQCSARGFVCEMCEDRKPIYAFDILNVTACRGCNTFVHRRCTTQNRSCRRCKRLKERKLQESRSRNGGGQHRNDGSIVIGLMDDRESFVSQQTQRMAAAEARRRSRSGTSQDTFLTFNNSLDRQGRNDRVHGNEPLRPDPSVSAGGPGEAPMLDVAPAPKNWHWRRGSKE